MELEKRHDDYCVEKKKVEYIPRKRLLMASLNMQPVTKNCDIVNTYRLSLKRTMRSATASENIK